jgi:hypothetical protein
VIELPGTDGFVLGPVCGGCLDAVAQRVADWTVAHPLATAEALPWCQAAQHAARSAGAR